MVSPISAAAVSLGPASDDVDMDSLEIQ